MGAAARSTMTAPVGKAPSPYRPVRAIWLDTRAAMAAIAPGDLLMVLPADHRVPPGGARTRAEIRKAAADPKPCKRWIMFAAESRVNGGRRRGIESRLPRRRPPPRMAKCSRGAPQIAFMRDHRDHPGRGETPALARRIPPPYRALRRRRQGWPAHRRIPLSDRHRFHGLGRLLRSRQRRRREYSWWTEQKLTMLIIWAQISVPCLSMSAA